MNRSTRLAFLSLSSLAVLCLTTFVRAQTVDPYYASTYSFVNLGSAAGVPTNYGGLTVKSGDPNTLLLGGSANTSAAGIYSVSMIRDASSHISGFTGTATRIANANGTSGGIDGGLIYLPNGTLAYTSYSDNNIGQLKPGSTTPDKLINMTALGVASSVGSIALVPTGFGGAGRLKILSYNSSNWYDALIAPDGNGTYDITNVTLKVNVGGSPEGLVYVPTGSPLFINPSVLVAEYGTGRISSYEVDSNGDALVATRRTFMSGLTGAEGSAIDPLTGDFLFSTFGGGQPSHLCARLCSCAKRSVYLDCWRSSRDPLYLASPSQVIPRKRRVVCSLS